MLLSEAASSWRPASCAGGTSSSFWLENGGVNQWSICKEQQCKTRSKAAGQSHGGLTESVECLEPAAGGPEAVLGEALVREAVHCGSFRSATATWSGKQRKRGVAKIVGERARNAFAGKGHISYLDQSEAPGGSCTGHRFACAALLPPPSPPRRNTTTFYASDQS